MSQIASRSQTIGLLSSNSRLRIPKTGNLVKGRPMSNCHRVLVLRMQRRHRQRARPHTASHQLVCLQRLARLQVTRHFRPSRFLHKTYSPQVSLRMIVDKLSCHLSIFRMTDFLPHQAATVRMQLLICDTKTSLMLVKEKG